MKRHLLGIAAISMAMVACTNENLSVDDQIGEEENNNSSVEVSPLMHTPLAAFNGNQNRVISSLSTRDGESTSAPGSLTLISYIENPSKNQNGVKGFVKEENGRFLSATCVYYDDNTDTYYATYHMQGNNYNTQLDTDVAGFIETFTINDNGEAELQKIFRTANPSELDFDFNHLYFDNMAQHTFFNGQIAGHVTEDRIIAVGHRWLPGKTNGYTQAIIGRVNLEGDPSIDYKVVYTNDKILDADGKSLGRIDAQDVNCVVRRYDTYYLATRRGIALLNADNEALFEPKKDWEGNDYFVKSNGSVKHVAATSGLYNSLSFLYLVEDFPQGFNYDSSIKGKLVTVNTEEDGITGQATIGYGTNDDNLIKNVTEKTISDLDNCGRSLSFANREFENPVSPIDGKNVLYMIPASSSQFFAALGKGGLYFRTDSYGGYEGHLDFDGRPVNGVFADEGSGNDNGFIYVCNGSKLTIFNRYKLDEVASYNLPNTEDGSANYVTVRRTDDLNTDGCYDRIITVAFGQAGLRVFRFSPKKAF